MEDRSPMTDKQWLQNKSKADEKVYDIVNPGKHLRNK